MAKIPQAIADPVQVGRRAGPDDMGGGEGTAALGAAVSGIGDITRQLLAEKSEREMEFFKQEMKSNVSGALAEADTKLRRLQFELEGTEDIHARNAQYLTGSEKIIRGLHAELRYPFYQDMFNDRVAGDVERGRINIASGVHDEQISRSIVKSDSLIATHLGAISRLEGDAVFDPAATETHLAEIKAEYDSRVPLLMNAREAKQAYDAVLGDVGNVMVRAMIREDPERASLMLLDFSEDSYFGSFMPPEVQARLQARAEASYLTQLRTENQKETRERADLKRQREEERDRVITEYDELLRIGDADSLETLEQGLDENQYVLKPEDIRRFKMRIDAGGGFGGGESDRNIYAIMADHARISSGSLKNDHPDTYESRSYRDVITAHYIGGALNHADYTALRKIRTDFRFNDARDYVKESLEPMPAATFPGARNVQQNALRLFDNWQLEPANKDATRADAFEYAQKSVDTFLNQAAKKTQEINQQQMVAAANAAYENGEITEEQRDQRMITIEGYSTAGDTP
jgi:hypothetical protein